MTPESGTGAEHPTGVVALAALDLEGTLVAALVAAFSGSEYELDRVTKWVLGEGIRDAFAGPSDPLKEAVYKTLGAAENRGLTERFLGGALAVSREDATLRSVIESVCPAALEYVVVPPTRAGRDRVVVAPRDLVCLLDRSDQDRQVSDLIEHHCASLRRRPIFAILPGAPRESHTNYIYRLKQWTLPDQLARKKLPAEVQDLTIYSRAADLSSLIADIARTFYDHLAVDDPGRLAAELRRRGYGAAIVTYSLRVSDWDEAKAVLEGLRRYWLDFPDLEERPLLLFVLSVIYDDLDKAGLNWWKRRVGRQRRDAWSSEIKALAATAAAGVTFRDLPELSRLPWALGESWISKMLSGREEAPMDDVAENLEEYLGSVLAQSREN
jgi:hypothetical protein